MKIAFASQTGNVAAFVEKLDMEAIEVIFGNEMIEEEFVLITYTDGDGEVPDFVEDFLDNNNANLRGVVASGNMAWADTFCFAADVVHEKYNVPILGKFEDDGTEEDIASVRSAILAL